MAGSARSAAAKHAYRMFTPSRGGGAGGTTRGTGGAGTAEEFDESDIWGSFGGVDSGSAAAGAELPGWARPIPASSSRGGAGAGAGRKKKPVDGGGGAAGSVPMSIPDWQKILGDEYRDHHRGGEWELDADDDVGGLSYGGGGRAEMVPPHELAWRGRAASMSVHEGVGRTLKGRDLSRVRDAVWKRTGFED